MNLKKVIFIAFVFAIFSFSVLSAQSRGMVGGYVTADAGTYYPPVVDIDVEIYLKADNTNFGLEYVATVQTDINGWYQYTLNPTYYPVGGRNGYTHVIIKCGKFTKTVEYIYGTIQVNFFFGQED
jgi:hypothetical protein